MTDVLDRLRAADVAAAHAPEPPAALLAAIVAEPRRTRRRTRSRLLAAAAVAALALVAVIADLPGERANLAARAYAQTAPGDAIVHSIENERTVVGGRTFRMRVERWVRGQDAHVVLTQYVDGKTLVYDQVVDERGVLRNKLPGGQIQELRQADGGESADVVANERRDAVALFRRAYEERALEDAGATSFGGRPAHAYTRATSLQAETFYLDASTGMPLGYEVRLAGKLGVTFTSSIDTFERLDPTPENLAKLRW